MNFIIGVDDFGKVIERQLNFVDKSLYPFDIAGKIRSGNSLNHAYSA